MAVPAQLRRNASLVVVAGLGFAVLLLFVTDFSQDLTPAEIDALRPLETIANGPGLWHGVGMGVLGLPISTWDAPAWLIRAYFLLVASAGLVVAFRRWVRPAGKVAWTAASLFAASWVPLAAGGYAQPSLYAALACVATAGFAMRWCVERDRGALVGIAGAIALAALFRPADGMALAAGLIIVVVVWVGRRSTPALAAAAAGLALGLVPWLALTLSADAAAAAVGPPLLDGYLALLEGPAPRPGADLELSWRGAAWALVLGALAISGIVQKRWNHRRNAGLVGVTVAAALLGVTLLAAPSPDAALLLPGYALLVLAVAAGLLDLWHHVARTVRTPLLTAGLIVVMAAAFVWQVALAARAT